MYIHIYIVNRNHICVTFVPPQKRTRLIIPLSSWDLTCYLTSFGDCYLSFLQLLLPKIITNQKRPPKKAANADIDSNVCPSRNKDSWWWEWKFSDLYAATLPYIQTYSIQSKYPPLLCSSRWSILSVFVMKQDQNMVQYS